MWTLTFDSGSTNLMVIFGVGGTVAIVAIIFSALLLVSRAKEQTKRELAAYVAEGTLDPDKAVAMINAGEGGEDQEEC